MFATTRRNRRRFQPSFDALSLRIAPATILPMPPDTSLDETTVPEIGRPGNRTAGEDQADLELHDSIPQTC